MGVLALLVALVQLGCTQQGGRPGSQAALAGGTASIAPSPDVAQVALLPGNTGVVGPGGAPAGSAASAGGAASSAEAMRNPQQLLQRAVAIATKLQSGEKTPQTLTAEEREVLLNVEALREQERRKRRD